MHLDKNNSKRALQVMKDLTQQRQSRASTVQDKQGKCLTEEQEIIDRWTEYCSELYNHQINADPSGLTCQESAYYDDHPILSEEVEAGTRALKNGKAAGVDNISAGLIKHGGETVPDGSKQLPALHTVECSMYWTLAWTPSGENAWLFRALPLYSCYDAPSPLTDVRSPCQFNCGAFFCQPSLTLFTHIQ